MLKKIMIGIIVVASIGFAKTNKEIIDEGNTRQKTIFDKYFSVKFKNSDKLSC